MTVLAAEWTKFRTVRGWVIAMIVAGLLVVGVGLLGHSQCGGIVVGGTTVSDSGCTSPLGPGGEAVNDSFYFVHQPLGADGSLTVRVTSLTGTAVPWSKAGIIVKASLRQGSAYAAMMVTGGHGVRMQWDYTQDVPGMTGTVSAAAPRWLRLTRAGDVITGYDSADGTHWTRVGTATLAGFGATAQAGLFAANPGTTAVTSKSATSGSSSGGVTASTATFAPVAPTLLMMPMSRVFSITIMKKMQKIRKIATMLMMANSTTSSDFSCSTALRMSCCRSSQVSTFNSPSSFMGS